jgi:hypothetical protein
VIPVPTDSDRQYERFWHLDLDRLDEVDVAVELQKIVHTLGTFPAAYERRWLVERRRVLLEAQRARTSIDFAVTVPATSGGLPNPCARVVVEVL